MAQDQTKNDVADTVPVALMVDYEAEAQRLMGRDARPALKLVSEIIAKAVEKEQSPCRSTHTTP